jgi:hypothetical protein
MYFVIGLHFEMLKFSRYSLSSATPAVNSFEQRIRSSNLARAESGGIADISIIVFLVIYSLMFLRILTLQRFFLGSQLGNLSGHVLKSIMRELPIEGAPDPGSC